MAPKKKNNAVAKRDDVKAVSFTTYTDENLPAVVKEKNVNAAQWNTMVQILYPAAKSPEIILACIDINNARGFDPLKKMFHIVPMWNSEAKRYVDTIWPSISELRATATRTGLYAGKDTPVFGESITEKFGKEEVTYPEWCEVTVYRLVNGQKCGFPERVYWKETMATTKEGWPNAMWKKRPQGQLAKCAEAGALRAAFPEEVGNSHVAEEMEGKAMDASGMVDVTPKKDDVDIVQQKLQEAAENNASNTEEKQEVDVEGFKLFLFDKDKEPTESVTFEMDVVGIADAFDTLSLAMFHWKDKSTRQELFDKNTILIEKLRESGEVDSITQLESIIKDGTE